MLIVSYIGNKCYLNIKLNLIIIEYKVNILKKYYKYMHVTCLNLKYNKLD